MSLLYLRGLPLKSIQERLGHASITTTGDIYVHLDLKQEIECYEHSIS